MKEITISVRDLVEFTLRQGDIDFKYIGRQRGRQGTKAHQKVQKSYRENYRAEVTIKDTIYYKDFAISLQGRMDGIIEENGTITIDEIKSTRVSQEEIKEDLNEMHWAQGKVYAFLYCKLNNLDSINVQLSYYHLDSKEITKFISNFTYRELTEYLFDRLLNKYIIWSTKTKNWIDVRNSSILGIGFPYESYRQGQRKLIISVYKTIEEGKKIYINAPTGIGKTISTLFPSILLLEKASIEKVFYLTSKNTQKEIVEATINHLIKNGLRIKYLSLTSKEKICFKEEVNCNPEYCKYAKGHFDRINKATEDIYTGENILTKDVISRYAEKHQVCPFEFSLDLSLWADIVVCDYNYIFDPRVSLKRFTEEKGKYAFLIDEAHNLVDRSRDMYSASLSKKEVLSLRRDIGSKHPLYKSLGKVNSEFLSIKKEEDFNEKERPDSFIDSLFDFMVKADKWLADHNTKTEHYKKILSFYFEVNNYIRMCEYFGDNYRVLIEHYKNDMNIKLLCLDSSQYIRESVENGSASIFFSATLIPMQYFVDLFGGNIEKDYHISLDSPFPQENAALMIATHISTIYKDRLNSVEPICGCISSMYQARQGNYMIFFPSYEYMEMVWEAFEEAEYSIPTIKQSRTMEDWERLEFLDVFKAKKDTVAFVVLGGIFSESIDLYGEQLIGTVIVSVGLPKLGVERDYLKEYYKQIDGKGFQYAYLYPGFNKVMQAVGRVIRSEKDKGVILLIDTRFARRDYKSLFPKHWKKAKSIDSIEKLEEELQSFWSSGL